MAIPIPPDLWRTLCEYLATHATCNVTIHQHEGRVVFLDLSTAKERVKAGQCENPLQKIVDTDLVKSSV